jgi:Transposase IS4
MVWFFREPIPEWYKCNRGLTATMAEENEADLELFGQEDLVETTTSQIDDDFLEGNIVEAANLSTDTPDDEDENLDATPDATPVGQWESVDDYEVHFDFDGPNGAVLEMCRTEVNRVLQKAKTFLPAGTGEIRDAMPTELLSVFLSSSLLDIMLPFMNSNLEAKATVEDIHSSRRAELMIRFHHTSPEAYFRPVHSHFPSSGTFMTHARYMQLLQALSTRPNDVPPNSEQWQPPFAPVKQMVSAMIALSERCSQVAFVPQLTRLCIDDDLLRMRSKIVSQLGFTHSNNPAKGMGIVHHAAVFIGTGLYLCGYLQAKQDSVLDCVTNLLLVLTCSTLVQRILLPGIGIFYDRGYGGTAGEVNNFVVQADGDVVGTSKRQKSFPLTFDQHLSANDGRLLVQEKGSSNQYWMKKRYSPTQTGKETTHFALAHRTGSSIVGQQVFSLPPYLYCTTWHVQTSETHYMSSQASKKYSG